MYDDAIASVRGARTDHFLLEKSRLARVDRGERSYHALYQIAAASGIDEAAHPLLKMGGVDDDEHHEGAHAAAWAETTSGLQGCGCSAHEVFAVAEVVAALLELGAVEFSGEDAAAISKGDVGKIGATLGVDADAWKACLLTRAARVLLSDDVAAPPRGRGGARGASSDVVAAPPRAYDLADSSNAGTPRRRRAGPWS